MTEDTSLQTQHEARIEQAVVQYVAREKAWKQDEYRLEPRGYTKDDKAIVWVIYQEDEAAPAPGAGRSIELHIDRKDYCVVRELRFQ